MRLCSRCNRRLRASRRRRNGLDDLGDEYGFFDEEIDTVVDEAIEWNGVSRWARLLRLAEREIRFGLNTFQAGRPVGVVQNTIYQAEQRLRQAADEIRQVTDKETRSSALGAISNAVTRLQFARNQLEGRSVVPGGRTLTSPADSMRGALEWIGHARRAMGLPVAN